MRNLKTGILILLLAYSCGEKLIEKPENLIPRDKMVLILKDMAILNAAKGVNLGILKDNGVEPTSYVLEKHDIDSALFVESDRYYASLPLEYEALYTEVEALLEEKRIQLEEENKIADSLKLLESKQKRDSVLDNVKSSTNLVQDTLQ